MTLLSRKYSSNLLEVKHLVDEDSDGIRLDQFLQMYLESFSREMVKKKIKEGEVVIFNRPGTHRPSTILHFKDEVTISFKKSHFEDEFWNNKKIELELVPEIIFEDENLIVISKPAFMSTHPAGRHIFNCATVYFEIKYNQTIHSLHRIDRETSGILMLGKSPTMAQTMMKNFDDEHVKKCYLFIAKKMPEYKNELEFIANERLASPDEGIKRVLVCAFDEHSNEGKIACTKFKILENLENHVIGLAFPQTGRQHQIRVHAKTHGLPLIGDKLYLGSYETFQHFKDQVASKEEYDLMEIPRHALHAIALKIPYLGKEQFFITKIPMDLGLWITKNTNLNLKTLEEKITLAAKNELKV
jgi:RluA family pseudouridine synthase